jgi:hypothetical protein
MSTPTLDGLRREGDAFMETLSREYYRAQAGLQSEAHFQEIYARHASLSSEDALDLTRETFRGTAPGTDDRRSARLMLDWVAETRVSRALAESDEREIAWEGSAIARLDDGTRVPYQRIAIDLANLTDRRDRMALEKARARLVQAELAPLRLQRFQRERDLVEALGIGPTYNATFAEVSGIDLAVLAAKCEGFLRDTQAMWDDIFRETVRDKLGLDPREATRADALALLRGREFDAAFPARALEDVVRRQMGEMGIDASADGRIIVDAEEREGKRARAFCSPVRVPSEVYLVLRPHGGQADYRTFLHELGHALHFGYTRRDYPFEFRWLGDNSVTESYAMLCDHLLHDPSWLRRYTELGKGDVAAFLRAAGFEELQFVRRYCSKFLYEVALYGGEVPWDALPDLYVETLGRGTSFKYDPADAFVDVDPRFYSARYLRAWQLQALLTETLRERFDADWYRNPRAGPWITSELFGEGQRELAEELAERVASRPLSFAPLMRATEALVSAS